MSTNPKKNNEHQGHFHQNIRSLKKEMQFLVWVSHGMWGAWADLFIVVCVECEAEQVRGIFGRAVRLSAFFMLNVFETKGRTMSITRGGPDQLGGPACTAQHWLQLPDLYH